MKKETEMKDKKWLQDSVTRVMQDLFSTPEPNYFDFEKANKQMRELVDQLDEPEVLSQKWINEKSIDTHVDTVNGEIQVTFILDDLKELLVPKQELPVIPKFVAEYIEEKREKNDNLLELGYEYFNGSVDYKTHKWIYLNINLFYRAWLDGYTVEEKKYRIHFGNHKYAQRFNEKWLSSQITDKEFASTFTKEEIKKLENSDLYWDNFAEEVTE